jgi:hypothetical protein
MSEPTISQLLEEIKNLKQAYNQVFQDCNDAKDAMINITQQATNINKSSSYNTPKFSKPETFEGDNNNTNSFIAQIELNIRAQPQMFTTEQAKIHFFASYLKKNAFHWYYNQEKQNLIPHNYNDLITLFKKYFGQQDEEQYAALHLERVVQKGSIAQYNQIFNKYAIIANYDDKALITRIKTKHKRLTLSHAKMSHIG